VPIFFIAHAFFINQQNKKLSLSVMLISGFQIFLSLNRTAFLALILGLLFQSWFSGWKFIKWRRIIIGIILLYIFDFFILNGDIIGFWTHRIKALQTLTYINFNNNWYDMIVEKRFEISGIADRIATLILGIDIWSINPFFGWGAGTIEKLVGDDFLKFGLIAEKYEYYDRLVGFERLNIPHNQILLVLTELGLIGFSFYIAILAYPFITLKKLKNQRDNSFIFNLNGGLYISLISFLLFTAPGIPTYLCFILTVALTKHLEISYGKSKRKKKYHLQKAW